VKFRVLIVGQSRCQWADAGVKEYTKRLRRFGGVKEEYVRAEPFRGDVEAVRLAESQRLMKLFRQDRVVALDERGVEKDTFGFRDVVDRGRRDGTLVFVVGGPYGLHQIVRAKAWRVVRLSSMVLNHDLARLVLYEQLYRSMTIIQGVPYHH
jgi:23S rRNA (pseudouridine1915-N3)-methyltransferase